MSALRSEDFFQTELLDVAPAKLFNILLEVTRPDEQIGVRPHVSLEEIQAVALARLREVIAQQEDPAVLIRVIISCKVDTKGRRKTARWLPAIASITLAAFPVVAFLVVAAFYDKGDVQPLASAIQPELTPQPEPTTPAQPELTTPAAQPKLTTLAQPELTTSAQPELTTPAQPELTTPAQPELTTPAAQPKPTVPAAQPKPTVPAAQPESAAQPVPHKPPAPPESAVPEAAAQPAPIPRVRRATPPRVNDTSTQPIPPLGSDALAESQE